MKNLNNLNKEKEEEHQDDLKLKELNQFIGTEYYHKGFLNVNLTDGVFYVSNNGYNWFVCDCIAVIRTELKNEEFLTIELKIENGKAKMMITDGNGKILYTQNYKSTNCKRNLKFFYTNNVLMLAQEY